MTYHVFSFPFTPSSTFAPQDHSVFMSWFWTLRAAASQVFLSNVEGELETPIVDWGVCLLANGKWWPISHGLQKTLGPSHRKSLSQDLLPLCFDVLILNIKSCSKSSLSKQCRRWVGSSHWGLGCLFVGQWKMMAYFTWATKDSWPIP